LKREKKKRIGGGDGRKRKARWGTEDGDPKSCGVTEKKGEWQLVKRKSRGEDFNIEAGLKGWSRAHCRSKMWGGGDSAKT